MAILTLSSEQQAVLNNLNTPMDDAFGDGIVAPLVPPYEKYKDLDPKYKTLTRNAFKSMIAAFLKVLEGAPTYSTPSYNTGWAAWPDAAYGPGVQYHKDAMGYVRVVGLVQSPASPVADQTMFFLPAGYRPAFNRAQIFPGVINNSFAPIQVGFDGTVVFRGTPQASTWVSINLSFKAG